MFRSTCTYNSQLNYMINEYKIQGYYIIKYLMSKHTFKGRHDVIKIILYPGICTCQTAPNDVRVKATSVKRSDQNIDWKLIQFTFFAG